MSKKSINMVQLLSFFSVNSKRTSKKIKAIMRDTASIMSIEAAKKRNIISVMSSNKSINDAVADGKNSSVVYAAKNYITAGNYNNDNRCAVK